MPITAYVIGIVMGVILGGYLGRLYYVKQYLKDLARIEAILKKSEDNFAERQRIYDESSQALDNSMADCKALHKEMSDIIDNYVELTRVTGILSHAWPDKTNILFYHRYDQVCRVVPECGGSWTKTLADFELRVAGEADATEGSVIQSALQSEAPRISHTA